MFAVERQIYSSDSDTEIICTRRKHSNAKKAKRPLCDSSSDESISSVSKLEVKRQKSSVDLDRIQSLSELERAVVASPDSVFNPELDPKEVVDQYAGDSEKENYEDDSGFVGIPASQISVDFRCPSQDKRVAIGDREENDAKHREEITNLDSYVDSGDEEVVRGINDEVHDGDSQQKPRKRQSAKRAEETMKEIHSKSQKIVRESSLKLGKHSAPQPPKSIQQRLDEHHFRLANQKAFPLTKSVPADLCASRQIDSNAPAIKQTKKERLLSKLGVVIPKVAPVLKKTDSFVVLGSVDERIPLIFKSVVDRAAHRDLKIKSKESRTYTNRLLSSVVGNGVLKSNVSRECTLPRLKEALKTEIQKKRSSEQLKHSVSTCSVTSGVNLFGSVDNLPTSGSHNFFTDSCDGGTVTMDSVDTEVTDIPPNKFHDSAEEASDEGLKEPLSPVSIKSNEVLLEGSMNSESEEDSFTVDERIFPQDLFTPVKKSIGISFAETQVRNEDDLMALCSGKFESQYDNNVFTFDSVPESTLNNSSTQHSSFMPNVRIEETIFSSPNASHQGREHMGFRNKVDAVDTDLGEEARDSGDFADRVNARLLASSKMLGPISFFDKLKTLAVPKIPLKQSIRERNAHGSPGDSNFDGDDGELSDVDGDLEDISQNDANMDSGEDNFDENDGKSDAETSDESVDEDVGRRRMGGFILSDEDSAMEDNESVADVSDVEAEPGTELHELQAFFDKEAELSGSGSEDEALEGDLDHYEEEGIADDKDLQELPDDRTLRCQIQRIQAKETLDEDAVNLELFKELYAADEHSGAMRKRNFRWASREKAEITAFQAVKTNSDSEGENDSDTEESSNWRKDRHEREVYLRQAKLSGQVMSQHKDNSLFKRMMDKAGLCRQASLDDNSQSNSCSMLTYKCAQLDRVAQQLSKPLTANSVSETSNKFAFSRAFDEGSMSNLL